MEAIWAPVDTVSVRKGWHRYIETRLADGLGGALATFTQYGGDSWLAHPDLFTLPNNSDATGNRRNETQEAIDSVCEQLADQDLPLEVFNDFGIYCPDDN